jgi:predicted TIM-barrel fold metal-dependent hydrolase
MIPLLDTHQHLIIRSKANYSWTKEIPSLATDDFSQEKYTEITSNFGIAGSIFMESAVDDSDYQKETKYIKTLINDSSNKIIGLISSIRPEDDKGFEHWLDVSIQMGVVGYRRILHEMPDEISQNEIFKKNIKKIGNVEKTFDMCFLARQLKIAIELAKDCSNTSMILDHCGVPDIANNAIDTWKEDIKLLSELPNVVCKLSGIMAYCATGTSSFETIEPYVNHVLESFGPKRILWGSDWPVVNLGKGLPEWIKVTRQILDKLSIDEANAIANGTAQNIYKVKL